MSWKATAYVKSLKLAPNGERLKRGEKLFLFVLADSHNEDRKGAWPSATRIASASLLSVRRVREIAKQCRRKGVICYDARELENGGTASNIYHFCALDCDHEPLANATPETGGGGEEISPPPPDISSPGGDEISARGGCGVSHGEGAESRTEGVRNGGSRPYIEPPVEPSTDPTHTRARARHPVAQAQRSLPGVCVGSRFSLEQCEEWASHRARQPGSKIGDASAVAFARFCDGKADESISKWFESQSPEKIEEARAKAENNNLTYGEALMRVRSRGPYDNRSPQEIIDGLPLDDDVRQLLIEKCVTKT